MNEDYIVTVYVMIDDLLKAMQHQTDVRARQEHDLVDTAEIAAQMQVPVAEVVSWITYGLLPEEARVGAGALFYRRQDIMAFMADHLTGPQVTELLDLSEKALHKLVEEGQLVALSGLYGGVLGDVYLFRRHVIEQWMRAKSG